ncbi:MAG: hypothetical protein KAJ29_02055 [Alphaproteobacteria bacterium]|nr:hypothetical protein [Alphaproteobacteria bacterium]
MGALEEFLDVNVNGNRISLNDQDGVVTMFGNVKETYQLDDKQGEVLRDMMLGTGDFKHERIRELLENIPAPKLVDLAAMMADEESNFGYSDFRKVKEEFELNPKYMREYRLMYEVGIKKSDGQFTEPSTDIKAFETELDEIKAKLDEKGWKGVSEGEEQIHDVVNPDTVQQVDFTKMR